jgi:uncharacterized protein (UPF0248 family)
MIDSIREQFNKSFQEKLYHQFLEEINDAYPHALDFRIAETPVFISKGMGEKMIQTCEYIVDQILRKDYTSKTENSIPPEEMVPGEEGNCQFIAFDFGICTNGKGELEPALIELQGFPTLFGFQAFYPSILEKHFSIPAGFSQFFNGITKESYIRTLYHIIVGNHNPENVILLELKPHEQKTRIDFYCTADLLGISVVCITEIETEGNKIFYIKEGKKIPVHRIYNRIIADELNQVKMTSKISFDMTALCDVEWVPHPNWFYRISKFSLPLLNHQYIPKTTLLSDFKSFSQNLDKFVLKPLFSFAGQGVIIDVTPEDLAKIKDPSNWILQEKKMYADCIPTPEGFAKTEIRIMYFWEPGRSRLIPVTNLARLSKGKMIGTRYNKDKTWVGGSVAYFEQ